MVPTRARALAVPVLAAIMLFGSTQVADATVVNCMGGGVTTSNVMYGTCNTDADNGSGSVVFTDGGFTVELNAKAKRGAKEVAASWQSNGPVSPTSRICVSVSVTDLRLTQNGAVEHMLGISYNGATQSLEVWSVSSAGDKQYCGTVPPGATNIWWQLLTLAGGADPGRAHVTESITGVSFS